MNEKEIALLVAGTVEEKKAHDIVILDIQGLSIIADYFVICHGNSETQVQSIVTEVKEKLGHSGIEIRGIEGYDNARWVLVDIGDVILHVFHRDEREFYKIERVWGDADTVQIAEN